MIMQLHHGDSLELLSQLPPESVRFIVCDPPYGLELIQYDWSQEKGLSRSIRNFKGFKGVGKTSKLPSFSSTSRYSTPNRTCSVCGGMERGTRRKCPCDRPHDHWKPIGKRRKLPPDTPDDFTGSGMHSQLLAIGIWHRKWLTECFRLLQPGGLIKVFSSARTGHRLVKAMQETGFLLQDVQTWAYSGWVKSNHVSIGDDDGFGTALKPCWEPLVVGVKP